MLKIEDEKELERFELWKKQQGYVGNDNDEILKKIFDAMEEDDK